MAGQSAAHRLYKRPPTLQHCQLAIQQDTTADLCNMSPSCRPVRGHTTFLVCTNDKFAHAGQWYILDRYAVLLLSIVAPSGLRCHLQGDPPPSSLHWLAQDALCRCCAILLASCRRQVSGCTPCNGSVKPLVVQIAGSTTINGRVSTFKFALLSLMQKMCCCWSYTPQVDRHAA